MRKEVLCVLCAFVGLVWGAEPALGDWRSALRQMQLELMGEGNLLTPETARTKPLPEGVTADYPQGHFLIQGGDRGVRHRITLPDWQGGAVFVYYRMRTENVEMGDMNWKNARVDLFFHDADFKHIPPYLKTFSKIGTSAWQEYVRVYYPPEGSKYLEVYPVNYGKAGICEIDGLFVQLVKERQDLASPDGRSEAEVFSLDDAFRRSTATRHQISLNGLWRFHYLKDDDARDVPPVAGTGWGWQKVPGSWRSDSRFGREQENATPAYVSQRVKELFPVPHWAWYRRRITIPQEWNGSRILLQLDNVNARAEIRIDGKPVGIIAFPCGEVDLTATATPGKECLVEMLVQALPMEQQTSMGATRTYKEVGELSNKGLCGEAILEAVPLGARISDVHVRTYVAQKRIEFNTGFWGLPQGDYQLQAVVRGPDNFEMRFPSQKIVSDGAAESRHSVSYDWIAPKLWDIDCPENLYTAEVSLLDAEGKLLDALYPEEFGFREFTIDGRNFRLNGSIIHLRSIANQVGANSAYAHEKAVAELVRRCRAIGVNFLIDGDSTYSFVPGKFAYQDAYRRVTSRMGLLTSLTMPNYRVCADLDSNPESQKSFRKLAEQRLRRYQNLPGLVMQSTSHNSCGYSDHQNPMKLGNGYIPENFGLVNRNRKQALVAGGILKALDPTRPVYHHDGGMLGDVHAPNQYENWAPAQERSDWLSDWEVNGVAPLFFVEYGMPHIASWASYRGPLFIWRNPAVQVFWVDEFNAETLGEQVYAMDDVKREYFSRNYIVEKQFSNKERRFTNVITPGLDLTRSLYVRKSLRDMNARGISACLPWDGGCLHKRISKGVPPTLPNPNAFKELKRPGLVPDYFTSSGGYLSDTINQYELTLTGKAFTECLTDPLQVWIAGRPGQFTESSRNYVEKEEVQKSLMLLNHTRHPKAFHYVWKAGSKKKTGLEVLEPGTRKEVKIAFSPKQDASEITIDVTCEAEAGKPPREWHETMKINLFPRKMQAKIASRIGCYDSPQQHRRITPNGHWQLSTRQLLEDKLGLRKVKEIQTQADLEGIQMLVLGPDALTEKLPFELATVLRNGLKVLVLAQKQDALLNIGLRPNVQGLRDLFPIDNAFPQKLSNWRGASASLAPYWKLADISPYPPFTWCGFEVAHTWRAGNLGIVAHILPEKPSKGNWLPLYQGGFDLQYAPLLYFTEEKAQVLICQLEVCNRQEVDKQMQPMGLVDDPQALQTLAQALEFLDKAQPAEAHRTWRAGSDALTAQLEATGVLSEPLDAAQVKPGDVIVLAHGAKMPANIQALVEAGVNILCCGMDADELAKVAGVKAVRGSFFTDYVNTLRAEPLFRGIGNSELHVRYPQEFDGFAEVGAGGVSLHCVRLGKGAVVMMQLPPWRWDSQFLAVRTTCRRADFTFMRLLANLGATFRTDFCERLGASSACEPFTDLTSGWEIAFDEQDQGVTEKWGENPQNATGWRPVAVGAYWENQFKERANYDGVAWYRLEFDIKSEGQRSGKAILELGAIDDESQVFINGKLVHEVTQKTHSDYWRVPRTIPLDSSFLRPETRQTIVIRCKDLRGNGGMSGRPRIKNALYDCFYVDTPVKEDDPYRYYHW